MATVKWSAFTSGTTIGGSDVTVGLQSGANVQWTMSQLKTWTSASPTLVTPTLGVATATSINKVALTAPATGSTLTIADGKTLTANNSLTLAGTDSTTMTFPSTSATIARTDAANTFTGAQTISGGTVNGTVLDISQTWGSTGTYTGINYDVADNGPSNAASLLLNLKVGGSSKFAVRKDGNYLYLGTASPGTGNYTIYQDNTSLILQPGSGTSSGCIHLAPNGASNWGLLACYATNSQVRIGSTGSFGFTSGATTAALDTILARDAADTLALRRSTNAQTFRVYKEADAGLTNTSFGYMEAGVTANTLILGSNKVGSPSVALTKLQINVDGTNKLDYNVTTGSAWTFASNIITSVSYSKTNVAIGSATNSGFSWSSGVPYISIAGTSHYAFTAAGIVANSTNSYGWAAGQADTGGADTLLARGAKKVVSVEAASSAGGTIRYIATSPAQITADQNNYNPGGTSFFQRWNSDAARNVTGMTFTAAQIDGQTHMIVNVGSQNIVLVHQSASSTAANRFLNSTGADITLSANQSAYLIYDNTQSRWLVFENN